MSVQRNAKASKCRWNVVLAILFVTTSFFNFFNACYLVDTHLRSSTSTTFSVLSDFTKKQKTIHTTNRNVISSGINNHETAKALNREIERLSFVIDSKHNDNLQNRTSAATSGTTHRKPMNLRREEDFFFSNFSLGGDVLHDTPPPNAEFLSQDAFSASWWQSKERFLEYDKVEQKTPSPEGASFEVFQKHKKYVRVTRDWMDLNIEHMSKWWKVLLNTRFGNQQIYDKYLPQILRIFQEYVYSADRSFFWNSLDDEPQSDANNDWLEVSQSTIAVIAFMPVGGPGGDQITTWSLAATLMSLVQLGVGRVVISGIDSDEAGQQIVQEAWNEIANATRDWPTSERKQMTTFAFCNCGNATIEYPNGKPPRPIPPNIPKTALRRLRHVYLKQVDETVRECWGGPSTSLTETTDDVMDRWQYVFLGEPDLILNTRPSVMAQLGKALKDGGVLAPHRLQPIPHGLNFGNANWENELGFLIPKVPPKLDDVIEIDHYTDESSLVGSERYHTASEEMTSCCDDGNQKPYKQFEDCGIWWWECGYHIIRSRYLKGGRSTELINMTFAMDAHKRVALYPFVKLKRGTGVVFAGSASGRRCLPSHGACRRSS